MLGRAHALFGEPSISGGPAAVDAGSRLEQAGQSVRNVVRTMSGMTGELSSQYGVFATDSATALDGAAGADSAVGTVLDNAALSDRSGRTESGVTVAEARNDTASLSPFVGTPGGQKALIAALRARVAQQHQVVAAYRTRDRQLAALLRSMRYGHMRSGGAGSYSPSTGLGGGMPGGPGLLSGLSGLTAMSGRRHRAPHAALVSQVDHRADTIAGGPGEVAARAALDKRGRPYVWGAKGPNSFDCSGLTGWAWRQAGVQLGADTYTQIHQGVEVSPGQVRAGDLIFPKDCFDARGPGHVQLAISPTQVVHAPQPGDVVRIAAMPSSYVARRPVPLAAVPN